LKTKVGELIGGVVGCRDWLLESKEVEETKFKLIYNDHKEKTNKKEDTVNFKTYRKMLRSGIEYDRTEKIT